MEMEQPISPMSVETEQTAPESTRTKSNVASSDVVATRHLRIVLESITADQNLSEEDRKRKIANFGAVLMANAAAKAPPMPMNDEQPEMKTTAVASAVSSHKQVSSPQSKDDKKMELIRAAVLANEEKRKKKSIPVNETKEPDTPRTVAAPETKKPDTPRPVAAPVPLAVISAPQQSQPEVKKEIATVAKPVGKPGMQKTTSTSSIMSPLPQKENSKPETRTTKNTLTASVIPLGTLSTQQPKTTSSKKKKGWLMRKLKGKKNRDERRGDYDERDYLSISEVGSEVTFDSRPVYDDYSMGFRSNASDDSDHSIGTFEKDYINGIVREQESHYEEQGDALSESTFEHDARATRALSALSEGTFEQDARTLDEEPSSRPTSTFVPRQLPQQAFGDVPNLSETTFEQDAHDRDGDYRNDGEFGMGGSGTSNGSIGSETTFERDMREKEEAKAAKVPPAHIFEAPSLDSVTTFEKEVRGRLASTARSKSFPQVDDYTESVSEDAASDCSDNFKQDFTPNMRPAKPEPQTERETTVATYPMPKISELELQLSPENISKNSRGRSFFSKFTCGYHCA